MTIKINHRDFFDKEEIKEISGLLKSGTITINHVHAYVAASVIDLYNDLYHSMCNLCHVESLGDGDIFKRETVSEWLENETDTWHRFRAGECFKACKDNSLIGTCGRGYTFDKGLIRDDETSRLASEMAVALLMA